LHAAGGGAWLASGGTITDSILAGNVVNSGSGFASVALSGGGLLDGGALAVEGSIIAGNVVNSDPGTGLAPGADVAGRGLELQGRAGRLTLNDSVVAGNVAFDAPSDIHVRDGGQVDPASANNVIGTGGSGGLVNGVNGNVVLCPSRAFSTALVSDHCLPDH